MNTKISTFALKALCVACIALGSSCDDYLEVTDEASVSPDNFPTTLEHCDLLLNSVYAGSHGQGLYAYHWFPQIMYLLDKNSDVYSNYDDRSSILINDTNKDCQYTQKAYADIMNWIRYANEAIEGCDAYEPKAAENELDDLHFMKGQALFFRALAYWHAQIFYELESKDGALGFPIIETVPEAISEMMPPRATAAECWQYVIDTLNEAIPLLKGHNTDKTRATEWAAKGLLAKSLMQARRSSEAISVLQDIFANSGAALLDWDTYSNAFFPDELYEFNKENLYEIDMTMNAKQNGPWAGYTSGSGMQMVWGPWPLNLDFRYKKPDEGKEIATQSVGAWGNNYVHDGSIWRFGWSLPVPGSRVENPNFSGKQSVDNLPWILDPDYAARSQEIRDNKEADPRMFLCCAQPYFDRMMAARGRETYYDRSPEALEQFDLHYFWTLKKFTNRQGTEAMLNYSSGANFPVIRLADLYLLYAEAIASTNPTEALEYVNKVHRRAYDQPINEPSEYDYKSLSDRTKAYDESDPLAYDPLKYERWAELFGEGQWWYDVRRYEILEAEMNYFKTTRNGDLIYRERCYAQPIPLTEVERYNGNIQQNYNY